MRSLSRTLLVLSCLIAMAACGCMLLLLVRSLRLPSPAWGEWQTVFLAQRIRAGLAVYMDPDVGAHDYGAVPSYAPMGYPPLASALYAVFPDPTVGGRLVSALAWFGALFGTALTGRRENLPWSVFTALLFGGMWTTGVSGLAAKPDALAVGLVAIALVLIIRQSSVGAAAAALLAIAAWTKPNVVGVTLGAMTGQLIVAPKLVVRPAAAFAVTSAIIGGTLFVLSGGQFMRQLVGATLAPFDVSLLASSILQMGPFLAMPLLLATVSLIHRRRESLLLCAVLAGSICWVVFSVTKGGRSGNYYMELCVVLTALVSRVPLAMPRPAIWAAFALCQSVWNGLATWHGVRADLEGRRERAAFVDRVSATCQPSPERVVLSDEPGIELAVNGRIVDDLFWPVVNGRASERTLVALAERPEIVCFVEHTQAMRGLSDVWQVIDRRFVTHEEGEYRLYLMR